MSNFDDEEVPSGFAKLIGHVCGVIFVGFLTLAGWILFALVTLEPKLNIPSITILVALFVICWFFGSTAYKLTTGAKTALITPMGYGILCAASILFACLMLFTAFSMAVSEGFSASRTLFMLACALISLLFSIYVYQHHIRKKP